MAEESFKRKLTTMFSADVAEYSRLMAKDEAATVKTLKAYREIMTELIKQHRGRVVDSPGDNLLAEFTSVVDAVQCAVSVQKELQARNAELPEDRRMEFRIGVNLGDVIEEEDRIYGDGVNIAARLEGLADPGGICISKTAFDQIETKLPLGYEFLGEQTVKNIAKPVGAYRLVMEPRVTVVGAGEEKRAWSVRRKAIFAGASAVLVLVIAAVIWSLYFRPTTSSVEKMADQLPEKPSIAVLPLINMSDDAKQEYFSDGFTDSIITALSRTPKLFVIARTSTFTYKGKAVKVQQVVNDLGVRYVLEGSIQRSNDRVRITVQLIDGKTGNHLWAEKYDRDLKDVFALQDDITKNIVIALRVKLTEGDQARIYSRATNSLEAYLKVMEGVHHVFQWNKNDLEIGRELYEEAIAIDPNYSSAYTLLAWAYRHEAAFLWTETPAKSYEKAIELAEKALTIDPTDSMANMALSFVFVQIGKLEEALAETKKAIALSPNDAEVNACAGMVFNYLGRDEESIERYEKAIEVNPINNYYYALFTRSLFSSGDYEKTIAIGKEAIKRKQLLLNVAYVNLIGSYILLGREEEARAAAAELLKVDPDFSLAKWTQIMNNFSAHPKFRAGIKRAAEAASQAGLK